MQPHDGSSIFVSGRLDSVSRSRSATDAEWTRGVGGGAFPNSSLKRPKFPASRENTGNFIDSRLGSASTAAKKHIKPEPYGPIPYAPEQGIFCGLAGNLNRQSGKFRKRPFLARLVVSRIGAILS